MKHPINWAAISAIVGPLTVVVGGVGRWVARKADAIGRHLESQDRRGRRQERRLMRLEGHAGLPPLPANGDDD